MRSALDRRALLALLPVLGAGCGHSAPEPAPLKLEVWERGLAVRSLDVPDMDMYLWFYEWNLFGAFAEGESSKGSYELERSVAADGLSGRIASEDLTLELAVDEHGVALELTATNRTERRFGPLAAIIPCFNPGPAEVRNQALAHHHATYYPGSTGLERAPAKEIHFNRELLGELRAVSPQLEFGFSKKWPTSDHPAVGGLVLRESRDGSFVTGIGWDAFLSVQAHNPWQCMHLSVSLAGLAPGETRTVAGRIWHFAGDREALYADYLARRP